MHTARYMGAAFICSGLIFAGYSYATEVPVSFSLTSTTFTDGGYLPPRVGAKGPPNPNCVGENISPQLAWHNPPAGTKSYSITIADPEGHGGLGLFHWIAYGIPADVTSFVEGEVSKPSPKYVAGKSTQGVGYYSGPCTPPGNVHHYVFLISATDLDPKALPPGLTLQQVRARLAGHTKAAAAMVGLYVKPGQ